MKVARVLLTSLSVCGFAAASAAGPAGLNAKPGLWKMTSTGEMQGAPPIPPEALAQMPPEQRARIRAAMANVMADSNKPHSYKFCVSQKDLERGFSPQEKRPGFECKTKVISRASSSMDVHEDCSGAHHHVSGNFHFDAPTPETMNGVIDMTMSDGAHKMHMKRVMHGEWIAADCGKYARHE
jgi:Protein of unknown function (DUF3617)